MRQMPKVAIFIDACHTRDPHAAPKRIILSRGASLTSSSKAGVAFSGLNVPLQLPAIFPIPCNEVHCAEKRPRVSHARFAPRLAPALRAALNGLLRAFAISRPLFVPKRRGWIERKSVTKPNSISTGCVPPPRVAPSHLHAPTGEHVGGSSCGLIDLVTSTLPETIMTL